MTKKIVMFFDERLNTDFRIVRFGKCIPVRQEIDNIYMFLNDRNLWTRCKKKMRENQSHIKIIITRKGEKCYVRNKRRFEKIRFWKLSGL